MPFGTSNDDIYNTQTATCCPCYENQDEEEIKLECIKKYRAYIKEQSRLAFYTKLLVPEVNIMHPVPFKRKLSTNHCPKHNFKIHKKEGL